MCYGIYSVTCLMQHALGEKFGVRIDRVSDYIDSVKHLEYDQEGMKINVG